MESAPAPAPMTMTAGGFHDMLKSLADLHDREVAELRAENLKLRSRASVDYSAAAPRAPTPAVEKAELKVAAAASNRPSDEAGEKVEHILSAGSHAPRRLSALEHLRDLQISTHNQQNQAAPRKTWTPDRHHELLSNASAQCSSPRSEERSHTSPPKPISLNMPEDSQPQVQERPQEVPMGICHRISEEGSIRALSSSQDSLDLPRNAQPVQTVRDKAHCGDFEVLPNWRPEQAKCLERRISFSRRVAPAAMPRSDSGEPFIYSGNSYFAKYMIRPSSPKRLVWDLVSMTLLGYDIIVIPFVGAFDPPPTPFMVTMTWSTLVFWTLDMPMSMITGYSNGKQTVVCPKRILVRYACTWLLLDILILGLDWTLVLLDAEDDAGSAARLGRTLRTLRFIRTLRLIRVLKLKRIVQTIQDLINTETVSICFGIMKIILSLVIANHIIACSWFGIGTLGEENGVSWIKVAGMDVRTLTYRYFTSLHWSLTQFTPASMEVFPQTVSERIFSVIILLFAMIAFSSFVSMLTASMAELKKISNDESRQFWLLRRYLRDWHVRRDVSLRIQRYLEYAYQRHRQKVQEKDVGLLALLSEPLREDLKFETFSNHLSAHPLFYRCDEQTRVFGRALAATSLASGDLAFGCGEHAHRVYFLSSGTLEYTLGEMGDSQTNVLDGGHKDLIYEGAWVCEAVLWTLWLHLGDLQAMTESQIITVDAKVFGDQVQINRPLWLAVQRYAQKFVNALNHCKREDLTDLNEQLFSPMEAIEESKFDLLSNGSRTDDGGRTDDEEDMTTSFSLLKQAARRASHTFFQGLSEVTDTNSMGVHTGVVPS